MRRHVSFAAALCVLAPALASGQVCAWSIVISKETGKLLAASTGGADGAFVVSGIRTDL